MKKAKRPLHILEQLSKGSTLCVKALAIYYDVSVRSIQTDFKNFREYFGEQLIKDGECYTLLNQEHFSQIFKNNPQTIKRFLHLVSMVDSSFYDDFIREHHNLLEELDFKTSPVYQIENSPYENLKEESRKLLDKLEYFISHQHYINITYTRSNIDTIYFYHSIPLKILYLKDNWYLAVLTTNETSSIFKKLRINFISKVQPSSIEPKYFHADHAQKIKADIFLKTIQSPFSDMQTPTYRVVLLVSVDVTRYFKSKCYLKSQRITKAFEDGSLLVEYEITNDMEIIPIVQRWIPYVRVIEPISLKEKIYKNVELFMKGE